MPTSGSSTGTEENNSGKKQVGEHKHIDYSVLEENSRKLLRKNWNIYGVKEDANVLWTSKLDYLMTLWDMDGPLFLLVVLLATERRGPF